MSDNKVLFNLPAHGHQDGGRALLNPVPGRLPDFDTRLGHFEFTTSPLSSAPLHDLTLRLANQTDSKARRSVDLPSITRYS